MRTLQEMHHCLVYSLGGREDTGVEDELADRTLCEVCHPLAFWRARISRSHLHDGLKKPEGDQLKRG